MSQRLISAEHELFEVLNAFPILNSTLEKLNISTKNILEGETIIDFLEKLQFDIEEAQVIINKLNFNAQHFIKNGELPEATIPVIEKKANVASLLELEMII